MFHPRLGQSGVILKGPAEDHALLVWGGMVPQGDEQDRVWHEVDSMYRYVHSSLLKQSDHSFFLSFTSTTSTTSYALDCHSLDNRYLLGD